MTATATATVALTKQEILRNVLSAAPSSEIYGTAENRVAVVTKEGEIFTAKYNDTVLASVKRVEDLAGLLIDHKYTMKAKWAMIAELKFDCEVPEGTPNKGGMKKAGGKLAELKASIKALVPAEIDKASAKELKEVLGKIAELVSAE